MLRFLILKTIHITFILVLSTNFFIGYSQDISVSPVVIQMTGKSGETINEVIKISNSGKSAYEFQVSLMDWKRDSIGNKIYAQAGTFIHSNAKWISFTESVFTLQPGQKKEFPIYVQVPTDIDTRMSTNSMLMITQVNPFNSETNHKSFDIKISFEFGVQLLYSPPLAELGQLEFKNIDYISNSTEKKVIVNIQNTGTIHKNAVISLELTNKKTGNELKLEPISIAIMPMDTQLIYFDIPDTLESGDYLILGLLDAGSNSDLKVAEKVVHVQD